MSNLTTPRQNTTLFAAGLITRSGLAMASYHYTVSVNSRKHRMLINPQGHDIIGKSGRVSTLVLLVVSASHRADPTRMQHNCKNSLIRMTSKSTHTYSLCRAKGYGGRIKGNLIYHPPTAKHADSRLIAGPEKSAYEREEPLLHSRVTGVKSRVTGVK